MATSTLARQTVLPEYTARGFPFRVSVDSGKTHFVHEDDVVGGSTGQTYCGRFRVRCKYPRDPLQALGAARNPCALCLQVMDDRDLRVVAAMATACSHHDVTVQDIYDTTND